MVSWGERFLRWGPWVALGLIVWRQIELEDSITEFVAAANTAVQKTIDNVDVRLREAVENAIETGRSEG